MDQIEQLKQWVSESDKIVFFGGAGVSTESGIPDFRGVDGLYKQKFEFSPEEIISRSFFWSRPAYFYNFYRQKMLPLEHAPNVTHLCLARWEQEGKDITVVTQNIDGLHQKAGSGKVLELHGSVLRNYCVNCHAAYPAEFIRDADGVPKCTKCGGIVKPDVVLYEESLNSRTLEKSVEAIENADLLIVAGTSLTVYPAAGLIRYFRGKHLVLVNLERTPYDLQADLVIHDKLGNVFSQL